MISRVVMSIAIVVLAGLSSSSGVFGYILSDLTLPQSAVAAAATTADRVITAPDEKTCLSAGKILYEDQCHQLLTQGPCARGQWLLLDDRWDGGGGGGGGLRGRRRRRRRQQQDERPWLRAKCARRRCSESDVYWPRDGFCYDADTAHRRRLCPSAGTVLAADEFGDGRCACLNHGSRGGDVPHVRLPGVDAADDRGGDYDADDDRGGEDDEDARPCHAAYTRGPCRRGHVIEPFAHGYGNCTADRCAEKRRWPQHLRQQSQQFREQTPLAPWTADGLCYELGTQGPCADSQKFSVARGAMRPTCVATVPLQLDLFSDKRTPSPDESSSSWSQEDPPCKTDHRGECVDGVDVPVDDAAQAFREQLLASAKLHAKRSKEKRKRTPGKLKH